MLEKIGFPIYRIQQHFCIIKDWKERFRNNYYESKKTV